MNVPTRKLFKSKTDVKLHLEIRGEILKWQGENSNEILEGSTWYFEQYQIVSMGRENKTNFVRYTNLDQEMINVT